MFPLLAQTGTGSETGLGAGVTAFSGLLGLVFLVFHIVVILDIVKHSEAAWQGAGQNKGLWIGLWVLGWCCFGIIIDVIYWFAIRPKLQAAARPGPGYPPPGYPT